MVAYDNSLICCPEARLSLLQSGGPIVLLSDFGHHDPYVGVMKGVILSFCPKAVIVDLCHEIPPQDVKTAAFWLRVSVPYFPKGSLFVCVVDPGVGSQRRILCARTARHQFLAPDNGLLSWVKDPLVEIRSVENKKLWLPTVSATFHGRDIFAPVAGRLAAGLKTSRLGPKVANIQRLPFPRPRRDKQGVNGEILIIDRFGNAVTNLSAKDVASSETLSFKGRRLPLRSHYAEAKPKEALALIGSSGYLELSIRNGDFSRARKARPGDQVHARN
ncbi:MAG: SAM-dependent chlorinase/fluorinase [Elusimicrobia bacterium]|nr:SAM-dependent chlorinase/fluorinase [Elusimicrobiota bacterium]